MKKSFITKIFAVCIAIVFVFAAGYIIFSVHNYDNILTALPLSTMIALETAFWGILIGILIICYVIAKKHIKK